MRKIGSLSSLTLALLACGCTTTSEGGGAATGAGSTGGAQACAAFDPASLGLADAKVTYFPADAAKGLTALADDPAHEPQLAFVADNRATCRRTCTASFRTEFTGHSTLEQMHRLQGQGVHSHEETRELVAEYKKGKHGWAIERVRLA